MESNTRRPNLVKLQKILIYIIIALFAACTVIGILNKRAGETASYLSVILLFLAAPVRMIWVGEYFRTTNQKKYQTMAYIVIGIIAMTVLLRLLLQNV